MKYRIALILPCVLIAGVAYGQDVPVPKSKIESLKAYEQRLDKQGQQYKPQQMRTKLDTVENSLNNTRTKLVDVAGAIQDNEKTLDGIEARMTTLQINKKELSEKLNADRASLSKLLLALERIRRVPPQALIMRPEAPIKTAQSAMLLGDIIPTLHAKAEKLKSDIKRHSTITAELEAQREKAIARKKDLKAQQIELSALAKQREKIYKTLQKDYKVKEIEAQQISRRSSNVRDLVSNLEKNQKRKQTRDIVRQAVLTAPPTIMPPSGSARLPISGVIKVRYNDIDKFGAKSEGIRIDGRSGGLVVSPMAGIIRFAGPFKNYDSMVIIEHEGGYHSLVAGLAKVDTLVGQKVSAGEPIGKLKSTTNADKPSLYYELRYKGNAIDPAKKLTDLG